MHYSDDTTIIIDAAMMGERWTDDDDLHAFARELEQRVGGYSIRVAEAHNGGGLNIDKIDDETWDRAHDSYQIERERPWKDDNE